MIAHPAEVLELFGDDPAAVDARARLEGYWTLYSQGHQPASVSAVLSDLTVFRRWCANTKTPPVPLTSTQLLAFANDLATAGRKRSTITRAMQSVAWLHRATGHAAPNKQEHFQMGMRVLAVELARSGRASPEQAAPLRSEGVEEILARLDADDTPRALRDAALIALASDTLARIAELAAVSIGDVQRFGKKFTVKIYAKGDRLRAGSYRHCTAETQALIARWCARANITQGPIFRAVLANKGASSRRDTARASAGVQRERVAKRALRPQEIRRILRRRAAQAGVAIPAGKRISGHSTRVGTANDLLLAGFSTAAIMNAGGWKSAAMVVRYTEEAAATENAVAQLRDRERRRSRAARDAQPVSRGQRYGGPDLGGLPALRRVRRGRCHLGTGADRRRDRVPAADEGRDRKSVV